MEDNQANDRSKTEANNDDGEYWMILLAAPIVNVSVEAGSEADCQVGEHVDTCEDPRVVFTAEGLTEDTWEDDAHGTGAGSCPEGADTGDDHIVCAEEADPTEDTRDCHNRDCKINI